MTVDVVESRAPLDPLADRPRRSIDAALDRYTRFPAGCPAELAQAIRYSLLAPGKRLRPALALLAAEAPVAVANPAQATGPAPRFDSGPGAPHCPFTADCSSSRVRRTSRPAAR